MQLVKDGKSDYVVIIAKDASPSEHRAAAEFQRFIEEMSGAAISYVSDSTNPPENAVLIGNSEALKSLGLNIDFNELGEEGYTIMTAGSRLVIAGGKLRGTMYGVYGFLEDVLGCRWYSSKVSKIPSKPTIDIDNLNITEKPAFEYREPFYTEAWDKDWAARNRANGATMKLDEETGGKLVYYPFVHSFDKLVPLDKYWDTHPEYFSMVKGERVRENTQLCMSNPDVLKIATATVMEWIREHPEAKIYSVSQNDWHRNCQCDNCRAIDEEEGSPSGLLLRFCNAIAEEVEKVYPDKLIDTLAYEWTEKPPKITKPRHNVRVRLCPIKCCEAHPYGSCDKQENIDFVSNLKEWAKITDNLYIWHYNTSFKHYLLPFPDYRQLPDSAKLYKKCGVVGVFWQGSYPEGGGGEFAELKSYLLAKLSWNPDADADAVVNDFLNGYYGAGGKYIREYIELLVDKVTKDNIHLSIWDEPTASFLTSEIIAKADELFAKAKEAAESQDVLERINKAYLSIEYVKLMQPIMRKEFTDKEKALNELDAFAAKCKGYGLTRFEEWNSMDITRDHFKKDLIGLE
ncbi:MAG: DUF4838 domain-containing protein [Armatimonadota bacterium]